MRTEWELLRALFEGALERPPHERAAFLDEHTKDDVRLRHELESLLAAHDAAGQFLSDPAIGPASQSPNASGGTDDPSPRTRLPPGTALGAFTVVDLLGVGGMGEVYRARDTRLDRFVAIKVLSSERDMARGGRTRFEREARLISRLSHPRICTLHDVGVAQIDGRDLPFLVMELLDGETLAARLARGPLSIEQALSYAIDIADALVAAHAQGIVHRDLKPGNVMVTGAGVKLLDFGLAQLRAPEEVEAPAAARSAGVPTSAGLVFGTLPYMSPEQLRGEKVDARTDIFAFGALLHEMLTGRRPFTADSQAALIAAILEHEAPEVSEAQPLAPANLDRVVGKCLAKDPDDRWQTARDLKSELIWVRDGREDARRARAAAVRTKRRLPWRHLVTVGIPTLAALALAVMLWRGAGSASPRTVTPLSLLFPPGVSLFLPINGTSIAIAPDGSRIAYIGSRQGVTSLFIHTLATGIPFEVPNTGNAATPMFFADSQWVAFGQGSLIKKVPAAGGPVEVIAPGAAGPMAWLSDGRFVRGNMSGSAIRQIIPDDRPITQVSEGEEGHITPLLMRNGWLLFTSVRGGFLSSLNSIRVWRPDRRQASELVPNASTPQLLGRDAIVFARGRALYAAGFDSRAVQLTGEPRAMNVQVQTTLYNGAPMYAVANNGTLVYAESPGARRLVWVDRDGREEVVKTEERMYSQLRLSPDGTRVATLVMDADRDLWVIGLDGSFEMRLTSGPERDVMPVWSPDGSEIFFTTRERTINRIPADGSTGPQTIFRQPPDARLHPLSITPDRKNLLVQWDTLPKRVDLQLLELGSTPKLKPLIGQSGTERDGQLSPDGKWVAYQSAEASPGGRDGQIMVRPFPNVDAFRRVISPSLGRQPIWSRDGSEIFYRTEDGTVMSVPIKTSAAPPYFTPGTPVAVVKPVNTIREWATGPNYAVSPDGRRFLFIKAPELDIRSLTVVLNWDVAVKAAIGGR